MFIIYKTTNLITGQIYIGYHTGDKKDYFGSGNYIVSAIKKYGEENFKREIIDWCYSFEHMLFMEVFHIQKNSECLVKNGGYNILGGGRGICKGFKHSKESNEKLSKALKGRKQPNISLGKKGYKVSDETKRKLSEWRTGRKRPKEITDRIISKTRGRKNTEETKIKMGIPVIQVDPKTNQIIGEYPSIKIAEKIIGVGGISGVCNNRPHYLTAGGYKWRFKENAG